MTDHHGKPGYGGRVSNKSTYFPLISLIPKHMIHHENHYERALIKAYSPHDVRYVGGSNNTEFNAANMAQFTPFIHNVNLDLTRIRLL